MNPRGDLLLSQVAFVVIGRNEGNRLRNSLNSVRAISEQLIYADSASSDGSPDLARSLGAVVAELSSPPLNAAHGRSAGATAAIEHFPHCQFIQFLDGDCEIDADWPRRAADFLEANADVAVVCGRRYEARPHASFYNLLADVEWNTPVGEAEACGGDSMMRVQALQAAGGFNINLMAGEEPELCGRIRALGWRVWRLDCPMTRHDLNMTRFSQWWRRTVRSGFGYAQVWHLSRRAGRPSPASQLRSALFWVLVVPLAAATLALLFQRWEILFAVPLAYALQIGRMARKRPGSIAFKWRSGLLMMIGKVAELTGAGRYVLSSSRAPSFEYKNLES